MLKITPRDPFIAKIFEKIFERRLLNKYHHIKCLLRNIYRENVSDEGKILVKKARENLVREKSCSRRW